MLRIILVAIGALLPVTTQAQQVSESWLRTAGDLCQGRFSAEASLDGEIEFGRFVELLGIQPGGSGQGAVNMTDLKRLLDDFSGDAKERALASYYECIGGFLAAATGDGSKITDDFLLDTSFVPPGIDVVPSDKKFSMKPGDLVGLTSEDVLLTFLGRANNQIYHALFRVTNVGNGDFGEILLPLGGVRQLRETECTLTLYNVDEAEQVVSLLFMCKS